MKEVAREGHYRKKEDIMEEEEEKKKRRGGAGQVISAWGCEKSKPDNVPQELQ